MKPYLAWKLSKYADQAGLKVTEIHSLLPPEGQDQTCASTLASNRLLEIPFPPQY